MLTKSANIEKGGDPSKPKDGDEGAQNALLCINVIMDDKNKCSVSSRRVQRNCRQMRCRASASSEECLLMIIGDKQKACLRCKRAVSGAFALQAPRAHLQLRRRHGCWKLSESPGLRFSTRVCRCCGSIGWQLGRCLYAQGRRVWRWLTASRCVSPEGEGALSHSC